ncbi:pantoate--beta-alanine ligase [Gordoniibacillus kamchatkensis]|uniref:Pantothenate synthetase n=1 Tax=Gordoniibacillus kamchatkensis TaxID=1590651 RepID=A0ABR5AG60_9BACL|nr:pantoate--beta-alanine ligase [Paenibacillus sp. VKM B-2647]KIL40029.1 pantoate--beta-alanine ligase [Paenibacillus sp. VKM B-2647]
MEIIETIAELRKRLGARRGQGHTVGFVPTMGYLHEGHRSLMERARTENDTVVLSIFVNPLQFGPNEDFDRYPRDKERDVAVAEQAGVDFIFMPTVSEMYPQPVNARVTVTGDVTTKLDAVSRPGHFDGVATVVSKLFHIVQPDRAYFGMKDAQQVAVIRQMVDDLNMNVTIVPCETEREEDGLAKSSRNVYLSPEERAQAVVLSQALAKAKKYALSQSSVTISELKSLLVNHISTAPLARIDYAEALTYPGFREIHTWYPELGTELIIALAVKFGNTRLIDNVILSGNQPFIR